MTNQQTQTYPTNNNDDEEEPDFSQKKNVEKQKSVINPHPQNKISDSQDNTHYPKSERKAPQYLNDYIKNSVEDSDQALINVDCCYKATSKILLSYKEVLNSSKAHCWIEAMHEEMKSQKENDVF